MKATDGLRAVVALGLLCMATVGCGRADGTYVLLKFEGNAGSGKAIRRIEVQLQFGARSDSARFEAPSGSSITLPTTAALQIRSGQGDLGVVATARAADGSSLATGSGYGRVVDGQTATVTVSFVAAAADAGVDGSADLPEVGADTGAWDGASGGGGAGGASGKDGSAGGDGATVLDASDASDATDADAAFGADAKPSFLPSLSRTTLDFGPTPVGGISAPQALTVTNLGSAVGPPLSVFINDGHHFPIAQDRCSGATLAPGGSCTLTFTFNPDAPGPLQTDGAISGGTQKVKFFLNGTGGSASTINLSPQSVDFNYVDIGVTVPITFTVTNKAVTDSGAIKVSVSPTASFQIASDRCAQTTLAQLGQCTFMLVFAPRSLGPVSGTILVESATSIAMSTATGVGQDHVQLTIEFAGTGGGSVSGPNLNCRSSAVSCNMGVTRTDPTAFPTINLSALPNAVSAFAGWSGGGCPSSGGCTVVMDATKTVTAKFDMQ